MRPILQYADLTAVPVAECGEPLVIVQEVAPSVVCSYLKRDMVPYLGEKFVLRSGAAERIARAAERLSNDHAGLTLRLAYAYRHPDVQRAYFEKRKQELAEAEPDLTEGELIAKTHLMTASPDVAGHPTGGAIDVTITGPNGDLDMGCDIADFASGKIETFTEDISASQAANRLLLRETLMHFGFAPFDGEWWHFSYGDREWAAYYGHASAIYDQREYSDKKN